MDKTLQDNNDSHVQGKVMGKNARDTQKKGFRGARSAQNSAGKSKPVQANLVPFEVKMSDFPELAGEKTGPPHVQKLGWCSAPRSTSAPIQTSVFSQRPDRRESPPQPQTQPTAANAKLDSSAASPGQTAVTSWANVASQPPKKPVPKEHTITSNHAQTEKNTTQQEEETSGKKKRKKRKKKAKGAGEAEEAEAEGPAVYQEPPKIEDEDEFPGLSLALTVNDWLITSTSSAKLFNEENHKEGIQHHSPDLSKQKLKASKGQTTAVAQKGQKVEKISGKKSKVPVQLDIGNMLATLEKKQQSQKNKQDSKSLVLSVGGGLPVVQKQPLAQKKPPWQQDKIAHNPLDSTSPLVKKGKQREVPKAKKPTPLKKVILKEREERKHRRLLEERGLLPEQESQPVDAADEEQDDANAADEVGWNTEDLSALNAANQMIKEDDEESNTDKIVGQQAILPEPCSANQPKIHSRKFRDYCSQMLSKEVDECVMNLLKELVRFQDRLYQKDPMKARMKRRIVMGLREVLKHLKLRKLKCVIISPNCERIQSKGGLDEALHTIIDTCREQGLPFVFALSRKALGRCVNKAVPVSLVGIFNYDGAQDIYHKMIELSSEARRAYEVMVSNLEQTNQSEEMVNSEEELQFSSLAEKSVDAQPEEPEFIKKLRTMLEKDYSPKPLNVEEQLSSMCLEGDCIENTEDEES